MHFKKLLTRIALVLFATLTPMAVLAQPVAQKRTKATEAQATLEKVRFERMFPGTRPERILSRTSHTLNFVGAMSSQLMNASADKTLVYGSLIGGSGYGSDIPYGIYSFPASSADPVTAVEVNSSLNANGGGVLVDDKYYFINFFDTGFGGIFAYFYAYNTESWSLITSNRVQLTSVATDLTYDPVTKKVYGCFLNDTMDGYVLGIMSTADGGVTPIANLNGPLFCIAANKEGELFGIDGSGRLLNFDKSSGSYTLVGTTGFLPKYTQSATFDQKTGVLYWAAMNDATSGLYTVDTTTGKATFVGNFQGQEEFGGLYIPGQAAVDAAPAAVENLTVTYDVATTASMDISFTMPTTTFDGSALSGELDYIISLNDEEKIVSSANAGEPVTERINNMTVGEFTVSVRIRNEAGDSPSEKVRKWIGADTPDAPTNLSATVDGASIVLAWNAPERGQHDGYVDASTVNYKIIRYPENRVIADKLTATTYTDTPDALSISAYWYEVIAFSGNSEGGSATSDKILLGSAFTVPYSETFDRASNFDLFTVIDANGDGITWRFDNSGSAVCSNSMTENANDWLITPPIHLANDYIYRLRFNAHAASSGWPEKIRVAFGTDRTVDAMTSELFGVTDINTVNSTAQETIFSIDTDDDYYFGFQSVSDAMMFKLSLDDISIEQAASVNAPVSVDDLTLKAGDNGAKSVTVTFTVPATTIKGEALTTVPRVTIRRGNSIVKSLKNQEPGASVSFVDTACELGYNEYTVYASNDFGDAIETTASVFVGFDLPGEPLNVLLKEVDGKAVLTWDAPAAGQNGGYIDTDALTYHILFGNDESTVIAMNVAGNSYTFDPMPSNSQYAQRYIVFAVNERGVGYGTSSNIIVFGTPYELPFNESFSDASIHYETWGIIDDDIDYSGVWEVLSYGTMPSATAQDGDGGLITFLPQYVGDEAYLYSGKIGIGSAINPVLEFYYFYPNGSTNELVVEASTNGYEFNAIKSIKFAELSGSSEWKKATISLTDCITESGYVQIAFRGIAHDGLTSIHLDNISVTDVLEYNLEASSISAPKRMTVGAESKIAVNVTNVGTKSFYTGEHQVSLYCDGKLVATQSGQFLSPGESYSYTFTHTPDPSSGETASFYAVIESSRDQNLKNNTTATAIVEIKVPHKPVPTELTASVNNSTVNLAWTAPDVTETVTQLDDFEDYEPFIIANIGDWTLADVDRQGTAYFNGSWPHMSEPQAFIVFNAPEIGADYDGGYESDWKAYSGDQCLISFIAETGNTDDWLISPMLSGKEQTISFYIKGVSGYTDNFEVLTSTATSAINRASFVALKGIGGNAPSAWTEISFTVPAGTNFFAIRHTADVNNGFALLVDDASFQAKAMVTPSLLGYNVYRNGVKINDETVTVCAFADMLAEGDIDYNVTALYNIGESAFSNTVTTKVASVDNAAIATRISITTAGQRIIVACAEGEAVSIYNVAGVEIAGFTAESNNSIDVAPGAYIVKVGNYAQTVIVK